MQAIALKRTDKVDWLSALKQYMKKEYTKDTFAAHKEAADVVNSLRRDVQMSTERNDAMLSLLLRYYNILVQIDQRFPVNEDNMKVQFVWFDSFKGSRKTSLYRVNFEKVCVLFNACATFSYLGAQQNLQSLDGMKEAARFFQLAAGFLQQIKDDVVFVVGQLTPDLSLDGLEMLQLLMLAQAQELFAERAAQQKMKPTIVAQLAASAAGMYRKAQVLLEGATLKGAADKSWYSYMPFKFNAMMALHHLCLGRQALEDAKYGLGVGYLQLAEQHATQARSFSVPPAISASFSAMAPLLQRELSDAVSDNERIYHESVPRPDALPAAVVKDMVKPTPVAPVIEQHRTGAELFADLLPVHVKKSMEKYTEDKQKLVAKFSDEQHEATKAAQQRLTELNLPDCLHVMHAVGLPEGLTRDIAEIKATNGPAHIRDLHRTVMGMGGECRAMHQSIIDSLDAEEREDTDLCQRYGRQWNRVPSAQLNRTFRSDLSTYSHNIEAARSSDETLQRKIDSYRPEFDLLMLPLEQLEALVPRGAPAKSLIDTPAAQEDVGDALQTMLRELEAVMQQRAAVVRQAEQAAAQDTSLKAELLSGSVAHDTAIAKALGVFDEPRSAAAQLDQRQAQLLEAIGSAHRAFLAQRQSSDLLSAKEAAIKRLRDAVVHFKEVVGNLQEGMQFYSRLQDVLRQLKQKTDDFLYARSVEKSELMRQIQMQTVASAGSQPQQPAGYYPPGYTAPQSQLQQSQQHYQPPPPQYQPPPPQQPTYHAPVVTSAPTQAPPGTYVPPGYVPPQQHEYGGHYRR